MSDLNDSDNIELWVTKTPSLPDITISNLKKVTDKRYNKEYTIYPLVSDPTKSIFNVTYPEKLILINTFQRLFATIYSGANIFLDLREERFLSSYFGEPFIDAWLWKESYQDVFEIVPCDKLNMTLNWLTVLYVDESTDTMLICRKAGYSGKILKLYGNVG